MARHLKIIIPLLAILLLTIHSQTATVTEQGPSTGFKEVNMSELLTSLGMTPEDLKKMQDKIASDNTKKEAATTTEPNNNPQTQPTTAPTP